MRQIFLTIASRANTLNIALCLGLVALIFCSQITVVIMRYLFSVGFIELQDLVSYSFAGLCVLSIPTAIRSDSHVRVDIFRRGQRHEVARAFDLTAIVVFLAPLFILTLWHGLPIIADSWSIFEGSRETGGLPGLFLVITALPVACVLSIMQGIAIVMDKEILHSQGDV
jgi:TRAP-type mannitol/chloroaromatic compound transport system permease small subunit